MSYYITTNSLVSPYTQMVSVSTSGMASEADVTAVRESLFKTNATVNALNAEQRRLEPVVSTLTKTVLDNPALKMLAALGDEMTADKASIKNLTIEVETLTAQLTEAKLALSRRESELTEQLKALQDELEEKNRAIDSVLLRANELVSAVAATVPRAAAAAAVASSSLTPVPTPVGDTPEISNIEVAPAFIKPKYVRYVHEPAPLIE
jgi:chromosome segregation ATPase